MAKQVIMSAMMQCSFGAAPSSLIVLPVNRVVVENQPAANIMDFKPTGNIPHVSGPRGPDPCSVRAGDNSSMGTRFSNGVDRQSARPERHEQVHVHLGRRHLYQQPRDNENRYSLRAMCLYTYIF